MEIWLTIKGFENYTISNFGNVRREVSNTNTKKGKILKQSSNGRYSTLSLQGREGEKTCLVHHLVARAFLGERPNGYEINHKNGNKKNNFYENLEYLTKKENAQHAIKFNLIKPHKGISHWNHKLTDKHVKEIRKLYKNKMSQRMIAGIFGICFQNVHCIVKRKNWGHIP